MMFKCNHCDKPAICMEIVESPDPNVEYYPDGIYYPLERSLRVQLLVDIIKQGMRLILVALRGPYKYNRGEVGGCIGIFRLDL